MCRFSSTRRISFRPKHRSNLCCARRREHRYLGIIASLEYGAAVLGVKVILVMGHGSCGAVDAAIQSKEVPGQISALYPHIQPAVDQAGPDLEASVKANAKFQADWLRKASTVVSVW
jgi:carbonic anhydrase